MHIGLVTDDPFGPVISFGAGGTMIELINDRAMELPPLEPVPGAQPDRALARYPKPWANGAARAVDLEALEQVLLRVSEMVCELPQLREMDINPIIVDESRCGGGGRAHCDGPCAPGGGRGVQSLYNHLAILPYPARYEQIWPLRGG